MAEHYDLILVGTGSGNSILNDEFSHLKVAVVEKGAFGGTCLNRGCIPSKMYVVPSVRAREAAHGEPFGVRTSFSGADWPGIRDRIFGRIDDNAASGRDYREGQDWIDVHTGTGRFTAPRAMTVDLEDGGTVEITGDQVVLATGSRPVVPPIEGLDRVEHHTSDTIMRLDALPERLGIVGGGYVGSEFAGIFSGLGSQVVQVESAPTLIGHHDEDVSRVFTAEAQDQWDVRLDASLDRVTSSGEVITLHLSDGSTAEVDTLLVAIGRKPNSDLLDVEKADIELDDRGLVVVDEHQRASAEGVWSLGDASSSEPLKHVANQDARVVQHNLLHPDDLVVSDHRFVPNAVFSTPQVAAVGLTEAQAREQGLDLAVATHAFGDVAHGWALREDDTDHLVKLIADRATGKLVGAHLIGPEASVLIQVLIMAMSLDIPVKGLARSQYWIHPALTEVVENALISLEAELGA